MPLSGVFLVRWSGASGSGVGSGAGAGSHNRNLGLGMAWFEAINPAVHIIDGADHAAHHVLIRVGDQIGQDDP